MAEKTYVVAVAHENMKVGDMVTSEPTGRMEALLGAGYYYVKNVAWPVVEVRAASLEFAEDDACDNELLERFEELDVVEVVTEKPKRTASPKRTQVE